MEKSGGDTEIEIGPVTGVARDSVGGAGPAAGDDQGIQACGSPRIYF